MPKLERNPRGSLGHSSETPEKHKRCCTFPLVSLVSLVRICALSSFPTRFQQRNHMFPVESSFLPVKQRVRCYSNRSCEVKDRCHLFSEHEQLRVALSEPCYLRGEGGKERRGATRAQRGSISSATCPGHAVPTLARLMTLR